MQLRRMAALLAVALLGAAACAAPVQQEQGPATQPSPTPAVTPGETPVTDEGFALEIENPMPHAMSVSYKIGDAVTALGTVEPGKTAHFRIPNRGADMVEITATDPSQTHTVRKSVDLDKGKVTRVTLSHH